MVTTQRPGAVDRVDEASAWSRIAPYVWAITRMALGWIFLWAFIDKMFGLGLATQSRTLGSTGKPDQGVPPFGAGPFEDFYTDRRRRLGGLAVHGRPAGIGVALLLGIGMRVAAVAGGLLLVLMWTAVLPPENNPFMDDHLIYAAVLAVLAAGDAGDTWGLGKQWATTRLVRSYPILR